VSAEALLRKIKGAQVIPLDDCSVVREGKKRFKVYLPSRLNTLWEALQGRKIDVWIVIRSPER